MEVFASVEEARKSNETTAYLAGRNGIHLFSEFGSSAAPIHFDIVKDVVPTQLDRIEEGMEVHQNRSIPMTLISRIIAIFRRVYEEHHAEFIVMLEWDSEKNQHILGRPKFQTIGPAYLKYDQQSPNIGTVHSHCNFSASFSSTDDANEKDQPGIYLVIGNLLASKPSMVGSITGCGNRYHLEIPSINPAYLSRKISDEEYAWWMETCQIKIDVESKTYGFFMLDAEGEILCWREMKHELEPLMGPGNVIVAKANLGEEQARMRKTTSTWQSQNVTRLEQEAKDRKEKDEKKTKAEASESTTAESSDTAKEAISDAKLDELTGYAMDLANSRGRMQKMFEAFLWRSCEKESEVADLVDNIRDMLKLAETQVIRDLTELENLAEEAEAKKEREKPSGIAIDILSDPLDMDCNGTEDGNFSPMLRVSSGLLVNGEAFCENEHDIPTLSREDWGDRVPDPQKEDTSGKMCPTCEGEEFLEVPDCTKDGDSLWVCMYCGHPWSIEQLVSIAEEELDLTIEEEERTIDNASEYDEEKPICPACKGEEFDKIGKDGEDEEWQCIGCGNVLDSDDVVWVPAEPDPGMPPSDEPPSVKPDPKESDLLEPACPVCVGTDLKKIAANNYKCNKCSLDFLGGEMLWTTRKEKEETQDDDDDTDDTEVIYYCRMCAIEVKPDTKECPNCGEEQPALTIEELEDLTQKEAHARVKEKYAFRCIRCKQVNNPGTKRCRVCSWEFSKEVGDEEEVVEEYIAEDDPIPPDTYIGNCSVCESSITAEDIRNGGCRVCSDREREALMMAGPACTACKEPITTTDVRLGVCPFCAAEFTQEVQPEWICPDCQGHGCIHCDQRGTIRMFGLVDPDGDDDDEGKAKVRIRV